MVLALTLLVRDEADIIGENIAYHLEQGVDHVIVTDNLSVDGTADIVDDYVRQGVATLLFETGRQFEQSKWVTRMARMAARDLGARWVINGDADEFWLPPPGRSLKTFFGRQTFYNVVEAPRRDFVLVDDDGRPFWKRMVYAKRRSCNALGRELPPKTAHRGSPDVVVAHGAHAVWGLGRPRILRDGLEIAHFPIRSKAQYFNKIRNGGGALAGGDDPAHIGDAWRAQFAELTATGSIDWFRENVDFGDRLHERLASGEAMIDRRVEACLSRRRPALPLRRTAAH